MVYNQAYFSLTLCKQIVFIRFRSFSFLVQCLNILHEHGINICKLESRPRINEPFRYSFYVDIEANGADQNTEKALKELAVEAEELKILGSYAKQINN